MRLPDGSVLMHGEAPYDPQKAHEYYLRTRQLHPRQTSGSFTVNEGRGHTVTLSAQQLIEQKAYAAARVAQIQKRLSDLNVLLRDKLQKAKAAEAKSSKPPTVAEKAAAARKAAAYRNSHKQELATKAKERASKTPAKSSSGGSSSSTSKPDTVDSLRQQITTTRANLKAAVEKQRELATAKKNG